MKRFRLWRLRRAYELISKLETRTSDDAEAGRMRQLFAADTIKFVDATARARGLSRQRRRALKRDLVR